MASKLPVKPSRKPRWCAGLVVACLLLVCGSACASVRLRVATLRVPGISVAGLQVVADSTADGRPQLRLDMARTTVPALGWNGVRVTLVGQPQRDAGGVWQFTGHVNTSNAPGDALADAGLKLRYDPDGGTLEVESAQGSSRLNVLMPVDQLSHVQLQVTALPLAWLRGVFAAAWPGGRVTAGQVSGGVALDLAAAATRISGRVSVSGVGVDSKAGNVAAQNLAAQGSFRIEFAAPAANVMFDGNLAGGQLLLGPLYAQLPGHPTNLHLLATLAPAGTRIDTLDYNDADALRVAGSVAFDRQGNLASLDLQQFAATFPAAYTRYGTTLLQRLTGRAALDTAGSLTGSLALGANGATAFALHASNLAMAGGGHGVAFAGLDGAVDWRTGATRPATRLRWDTLALDRLVLGPGQIALQDERGALTLEAPLTATFFGGSFQLARLAWRPDAVAAQRLAAAFSVTDVDLASLCEALGWPAFQGKLGGAVPELSYRGDELTFAGGLSLHVFDGSVSVTNLGIRNPLGAAPMVAADIDLQQLDLAQLTSVFDFGQISGRLNGGIHGLQLVAWKPTAFTARLTADSGGKISQRAIRSLTSVGGGGIGGGLQGMAMRLFKTFGYARIELGCTLANGVCTMSGIEPEPDPGSPGYTIVSGSGLPHITVIGHERTVDWTTLVARLQAAAAGQAPVIR